MCGYRAFSGQEENLSGNVSGVLGVRVLWLHIPDDRAYGDSMAASSSSAAFPGFLRQTPVQLRFARSFCARATFTVGQAARRAKRQSAYLLNLS